MVTAVILGALVFSTGSKLKKLSETEQDHYAALRVWMDKDDQKAYFKLKTEEERNQWLKDNALWDRFYDHPDYIREQIMFGDVDLGWGQNMVFMAWGKPYRKKRLTGRPAARSELFVYRFEVAADGAIMPWIEGSKATYKAVDMYQLEVYVDDEVVTEMVKKDKWE
jgi:hypothetical protein